MGTRGLSIIVGIGVAVLLLVAGGVAYLRSIDFNAYRTVIVDRLERITGRDVAIGGDLDVSLSLTPTLIAEDVTLGNADWGSRPVMARAERIELEIRLLPLVLDGDVRVDRLVAVRPHILLETDREGNGNWEFHLGRPRETEEEPFDPGEFLLEDVTIREAEVVWRGGSGQPEEIGIERFVWQAEGVTNRLSLSGNGVYRSLPIEVTGSVGSLTNLLREGNPYPVDLRVATVADIVATVEGQLGADPRGGDFALEVDATGADIEPLGPLVRMPLPSFGPFEAHFELINDEERLSARELRLSAGDPRETRIEARGSVAALAAGKGVDLALKAEGARLGRLAALAGIEIGPFGPYVIETRLTDAEGGNLALTDLTATAGDAATRVTAAGAIRRPLRGEGLDLALTAEGSGLEGLSPLLGADLPPLGPYRIRGRLTDPGDAGYRLADMEAEIGRSRLGGRVLLTLPAEAPPRVEGVLSAGLLDLNELLEAWAPAPAEEPAESDRVFSDERFELGVLRAVDADLELQAATVALGGVRLQDVGMELVLDRGRLAIEPLTFDMAEGQANARLVLNGGASSLTAATRLDMTGLNVGTAMARLADLDNLSGSASLDLDLQSAGQSVAALMAQLDGEAAFVMPHGRIVGTDLHRMVTDLDVLRLLPFLSPIRDLGGAEGIDINCFIGRSLIERGRAAVELLLDTNHMILAGSGTIDLAAETIDLRLVPEAKSAKLSAVAVPVDIRGSLAAPAVEPRTDVAIGQGVAGIVGGLLLPLNLLAGLTGGEAESACPATVAEAAETLTTPRDQPEGNLPVGEPPEGARPDTDTAEPRPHRERGRLR